MNRGNQRQNIFRDDQDRLRFLETLGEACAKTGWQVHAFCLMRNHFHLVIETRRGELVAGIKFLLGIYTKRFNIRHKTCGHPFAGRYKALPVDGSGNGYPNRLRLRSPEPTPGASCHPVENFFHKILVKLYLMQ